MARLPSRIAAFFLELRRRKVYQVTVAYVLLAAAGIELVDILVPDTSLPDWSGAFLLALAIVGFPVVVVLSWTFDITSEGVIRASKRDGTQRERRPELPEDEGVSTREASSRLPQAAPSTARSDPASAPDETDPGRALNDDEGTPPVDGGRKHSGAEPEPTAVSFPSRI